MVLKIDNMSLDVVRIVIENEINDVYICRDENAVSETYYTLIYIKNHETARDFLDAFESCDSSKTVLIKNFAYQNAFCFLFDYRRERNLEEFYMGKTFSVYRCEEICLRIVLECISTGIPYPLLYEILKQKQINMSKDNSIYFNYQIDLTDFDKKRDEHDCVIKCAIIIKELLKIHEGTNSISYNLLNKKIPKNSYVTFNELYKDIKLSVTPDKEAGIISRIKRFLNKHRLFFFNMFIFMCIVVAILAFMVFFSQIVFRDTPIYRLFINTFKTIGTETMLQ